MKRTSYTAQSHTKFFLLLFSVVFATGLLAQPAASLSVQGVLTRSDGTAVDDGTYSVSFKLFDAPNGGNQVHSESIDVETIGGVYSVILGANPNSPLTASFNTIYYLSVTVGSSELTPRPRLTHAPYAMSLIGQNNTFPSTGAVIADAINIAGTSSAVSMKANGGAPTAGVTVNGFSFKNGTGGDADGGLFSIGDNNVGLYANATKALEASGAGVSIPGTLNVSGQTTTGAQTVNGNETVTGISQTNGKVLTNFEGAGGGYSFVGDGAFDSGLFGKLDGELAIKANGTDRILIGGNGVNYISGQTIFTNGNFNVQGLPFGDRRNMQYDDGDGKFYWDNSSRRFKENISPLADNFKLILSAKPKTYTRPNVPDIWEIGYIAEEMDSLGLGKLVEWNRDGEIVGYNYEKMILYVTEVLKIHEADIAALKAENAQLQSSNAALRSENSHLQTAMGTQLNELAKRLDLLENRSGENHRK